MAGFDKIKELVKKHPVLIIGGGGAILIGGYILLSGSSSSSASTATTSGSSDIGPNTAAVDEASISANAQTAVATAQANATNTQYSSQLSALQSQYSEQLAQDAQDQNANITVAGINAQVQNNANNDSTALGTLTAQLQAAVTSLQSNNSLAGQENTNATALATTQASDATQLGVIQTESNANVQVAGLNDAANVSIAQGQDALQSTIAQYQAQTAQATALDNTNAILGVSSNQSGVAEAQAGASAAGGLFGAIASIF